MSSSLLNNTFLEKINTEYENSFTIAALTAKEIGMEDESLLAAKRVFSYNPNSRIIRSTFPQFASAIEKISKLIDFYGNSLSDSDSPSSHWSILGYCYLTLGDFPNSFAAFAHGIRVMPETKETVFWYAMGIVYAHYKYYDNAEKCYQKALDSDVKFQFSNDLRFRLGLISRITGFPSPSISYFESVMGTPPNGLLPEDVEFQIAYTYQQAGQFEKASYIYTKLHNKFPGSLKVSQQYFYFLLLSHQNDLPVLKVALDNIIQNYPQDPTLLLIAARIAMMNDDMTTAYQYYRYCISYCSDSPYFWCGLAVLYFKNEQTHDAIIAFQRALYLKGELAEAWLNIGLIYEKQGDIANAIKIYTTGLQKCPNNNDIQERIEYLNSNSRRKTLPANYHLIDIDNANFIVPIPEQFALDYMAAVPKLPDSCFLREYIPKEYQILSTYPKSYFL